jgi:N-acetylmuramoyl-L-alanine amidase
MVSILGTRGASAVMGLIMLATASSGASAQSVAVTPASLPTGASAYQKALSTPVGTVSNGTAYVAASPSGTVTITAPAKAVTVALPPPAPVTLASLVDTFSAGDPLDTETGCLATAVYFESRGEPLEGQLAVARVVINRAASGRYPTSWCGVVKQKAQFSFVRHGLFPRVDESSDSWRKAQAIARIAARNAMSILPTDVLWYHANYVAPSWRRNLRQVQRVGAHIFYRS